MPPVSALVLTAELTPMPVSAAKTDMHDKNKMMRIFIAREVT
jgi:hypothetical protein